jgi:hypothetical protein
MNHFSTTEALAGLRGSRIPDQNILVMRLAGSDQNPYATWPRAFRQNYSCCDIVLAQGALEQPLPDLPEHELTRLPARGKPGLPMSFSVGRLRQENG